jgi:hypothetical protein
MKLLLVLPLLAASITPAFAQQTPAPQTPAQPPTAEQTPPPQTPQPTTVEQPPAPQTTPQPATVEQTTPPQPTAEQVPTPQLTAPQPTTALVVGPAPAAPVPDNSAIDDYIFIQEMRMWQALQAHDLVTLQALFLPDFVEVEKSILTREQVMANLNTCTLVGFNMHNHQTRVLSSDAVVIAYSGSNEFTCGESHLKGNYNATTTWVLRNGRWVVQVHTEIPVRS